LDGKLQGQRETIPYVVNGITTLLAGQKYVATYVYDGSTVYLYLNGALEATANLGSIASTTLMPLLGAELWNGSPASMFDGKIFGASIFNTALTQSQIQEFSKLLDTSPSAPTITSIAASGTQLSVAFTAGSNAGTSILRYQYSTDGGSTWRDRTTGTTASPLVISTSSSNNSVLTNITTYSVQIRAVNTITGSPSLTTQATTTDDTAPSLSSPTVSSTSPTGTTLNFTSSETGTYFYKIQFANTDDPVDATAVEKLSAEKVAAWNELAPNIGKPGFPMHRGFSWMVRQLYGGVPPDPRINSAFTAIAFDEGYLDEIKAGTP
jgi:hypothetical protein